MTQEQVEKRMVELRRVLQANPREETNWFKRAIRKQLERLARCIKTTKGKQ